MITVGPATNRVSYDPDSHAVQILLKGSASAQPNYTRQSWAPWDAFVYVADPDALAGELASRYVALHKTIRNREDGLRGFEVQDPDGYIILFGRPL